MDNILAKIHNQKLSSRAKVIYVIEEILNGQSLASLLDTLLSNVAASDRGFAHTLLLGTLRQWHALSRIGESLLQKQPDDHAVIAAINVGLYQLLYMDTPDYAAINDTVQALKQLDKAYAAGLVNAILRKVQQSPTKYSKKVSKNHSLPNWLAKQLKQDWAACYDDLGASLRVSAPIFLRVNERFVSVADYAAMLTQHGIEHCVEPLGLSDVVTIRLISAVRIADLPHFADGWVTVQDLHAQLAAHLLDDFLDTPKRVLDMCAAPGGKTTHLLEKFHVKHLTALDSDAGRLARVQQNLERLQLQADHITLVAADGTSWQADAPFEVILLDAPCTATGVLRRHPDIALLRQERDVAQTVQLQAQILHNAWQQLAVGGVLLYVTCSLLKAENEQQMLKFVQLQKDAQVIDFKLNLPNQYPQQIGYQCLPLNPEGGDGFYYALLQKRSAN